MWERKSETRDRAIARKKNIERERERYSVIQPTNYNHENECVTTKHKEREREKKKRIKINLQANNILYITDSIHEVKCASSTGMKVALMKRNQKKGSVQQNKLSKKLLTINSIADILFKTWYIWKKENIQWKYDSSTWTATSTNVLGLVSGGW